MDGSKNILFPVDFSPRLRCYGCLCQEGETMLYGAKVSLVHVVDLASRNGFELFLRPALEIAEEHLQIGQERLDSFLTVEFPLGLCRRILVSGDAATRIAQIAREGRFDLIVMPTHAGFFRRMLLGSTTAKVLNDADCPVLTSMHAETIAPKPLEHREWLCAVGLSANSERLLRFAAQGAMEVRSKLTIIHAVQALDSELPIELDLKEQFHLTERQLARERIEELQRTTGCEALVRIAVGPIKKALLEIARQSDADALIIGRSPRPGAHGRMRDLTYAMVRESPFPVLSV